MLKPPVVMDAGARIPPVHFPWIYFGASVIVSLVVLRAGFVAFEKSKWVLMERL